MNFNHFLEFNQHHLSEGKSVKDVKKWKFQKLKIEFLSVDDGFMFFV